MHLEPDPREPQLPATGMDSVSTATPVVDIQLGASAQFPYSSLNEWAGDMKRLFQNARDFEPDLNDEVHQASIHLEKKFVRELEKLRLQRKQRNRPCVMVERREFTSVQVNGSMDNVFVVESGRVRWYDCKFHHQMYAPWTACRITR